MGVPCAGPRCPLRSRWAGLGWLASCPIAAAGRRTGAPGAGCGAGGRRALHAGRQQVALTSERYGLRRLPFARLSGGDVAFFERLLPGRAVTDPQELELFNVDWLKSVRGTCCAGLLTAGLW